MTAAAEFPIQEEWLNFSTALRAMAATTSATTAMLRQRADEAARRAGIKGEARPEKVDRILWNEAGVDIDEIVVHDCMVHVEQMNDRCWWIGIYKGDGSMWTGNFRCDSRGRMQFTEQDAELAWDQDEEHGQ